MYSTPRHSLGPYIRRTAWEDGEKGGPSKRRIVPGCVLAPYPLQPGGLGANLRAVFTVLGRLRAPKALKPCIATPLWGLVAPD
jgi:hypothetical protein